MFFVNRYQKVSLIGRGLLAILIPAVLAFGLNPATAQTTAAEQTTTSTDPATAAAAQPAPQLMTLQPLDAVISEVTGKSVQVSLDGKTWQPARKGQALGRGAAIRTGFASSCEVDFGDHSVLQILALSSVSIADYAGAINVEERVQANLQYGALRCGVEKGRVQTDTKISTPISTLSIRGTYIYVEYDPGTRRCKLKVDEDGPALASTFTKDCFGLALDGNYLLNEGMYTDCCLSRFLKLAIFDRTVWVTGNYALGDITDEEANALIYTTFTGGTDPTRGGLQFNDDRLRNNQRVTEFVIQGGGIPIGSGGSPGSQNPLTDYSLSNKSIRNK